MLKEYFWQKKAKRCVASMPKIFCKTIAVILITIIFMNLSVGCKKTDDSENRAASSATKATSATAARTAAARTAAARTAAAATTADAAKSAAQRAEAGADAETGVTSETGEVSDVPGDADEPKDWNEIITEDRKIDLGGMVIDIEVIQDVRIPTPDSSVELRVIEWNLAREIEKKYNCVLNFTAECKNNDTLKNTMTANLMAGMEYREVLYVTDSWIIPKLVESGGFLRLDEYLPKDSFVYQNLIEGFAHWKGHDYGIVPLGKAWGAGYVTGYNKEVLDRLGIDIWEQYVNTGNWNWETFLEVALAATQDLNGDGIIDQWGLKGWSEQSICLAFVASNGGSFINTEGGKVEYVLHKDPKSVKALQFVSDLYNIYKVTYLGGNTTEDMLNNRAAMSIFRAGSFSGTYFPDPARTNEKIFVAPLPKGPDSNQQVLTIHTYYDMMAFPNIIGNPNKEVVEVMAEFYAEAYKKAAGEGGRIRDIVSTLCTEWFRNNPSTIELYLKCVDLAEEPVMQKLDLYQGLRTAIENNIFKEAIKSGVPVMTKLEETKNMMQGYIDAVLNY